MYGIAERAKGKGCIIDSREGIDEGFDRDVEDCTATGRASMGLSQRGRSSGFQPSQEMSSLVLQL